MSKNWSCKETVPGKDQKCACSDNSGQNIWNKVEYSSKTGQEKKSLVSVYFLTAIREV